MPVPIIAAMTFDELINHFGTQQAAADAIGISQPSVSGWREGGIPLPRQYQIQVITGGRLQATPIPRESRDVA